MFFQKIDESISKAMLEIHGNDFINHFFKFFTMLGDAGLIWILFLLTILIVVIIKKRKLPIVLISISLFLLVGWSFCELLLKIIIQKTRPLYNYSVFGDEFKIFLDSISYPYPSSYSFPSGHTVSSFIAATGITLYKKKLGFIAFPLAFIIAFSRVFIGAHYFSDVLFSSLIGIAFGVGGYFVGNKLLLIDKIKGWKYATR